MAVQAAREAAAAAAAEAERAVLEEVLAQLSDEDDGGGALGLSNLMSASVSQGSLEGAEREDAGSAAAADGDVAELRRLPTPEEVFKQVFESMPGPPSVAIVCQKLGNEAHTKFEDRSRLPIGALGRAAAALS
jgi:hypothetical protein